MMIWWPCSPNEVKYGKKLHPQKDELSLIEKSMLKERDPIRKKKKIIDCHEPKSSKLLKKST